MTCPTYRILLGDSLQRLRDLPSDSVQTAVSSPPYWGLRDYGVAGQLGLEPTPDLFVERLVEVFREVRRVLRSDGTLWLNLGDSYCNTDKWGGGGQNTGKQTVDADGSVPSWAVRAKRNPIDGLKPKDLVGIPWRVAFALQADGWWLRMDIIWDKPNPMPESVQDRPTRAHEYVFLLSKSQKYLYDAAAIAEPLLHPKDSTAADISRAFSRRRAAAPVIRQVDAQVQGETPTTRNKRSVWRIATHPYPEAHFATFPEDLVRPCILAGSRPGDLVLDPFSGSGTTGAVAIAAGRSFVGVELNPEYVEMSRRRISGVAPLLAKEVA